MTKRKSSFLMEVRDAKFYEGTIATDTPVMREHGEEEILVMHPKSIELHTKEVPLLENHDMNKQIGIVENIRLVGKKLMGQIRFANDSYSQMLKEDVDDNIRQNLSIGYRILDYVYEGAKKMVTKFSIHEVSLVPIPADQNAGIGRSMSNADYFVRNINLKGKEMEEKLSRNQKKNLREEISEIRALAKRHNMDDLGDDAIDSGMSLNEFRKLILKEIDNSEPLSTGKAPMINLRSSDETYSISNAIRGCINPKEKGIEHEISQDYQRNQELKNEHGVIVPTEAILGQRTMTVGNLVAMYLNIRCIKTNPFCSESWCLFINGINRLLDLVQM